MIAGQLSTSVGRATTSPASSTIGRWRRAPTARIAACGWLITAEKLSMPYIPRFETLNVAPESSAGVIEPSRTRAASARGGGDLGQRLGVGIEDRWDDQGVWSATAMPTLTRE